MLNEMIEKIVQRITDEAVENIVLRLSKQYGVTCPIYVGRANLRRLVRD